MKKEEKIRNIKIRRPTTYTTEGNPFEISINFPEGSGLEGKIIANKISLFREIDEVKDRGFKARPLKILIEDIDIDKSEIKVKE